MSKIFIDSGHNDSGWNTGAVGNGLKEQDINFEVAKQLGKILEERGITVKLSRPTKETNLGRDSSTSINTRVNMANNWNADYFISIHCNAGGGTGAETLYKLYKDYAQTIHSRYIKEMKIRDRGIKIRNDLGVLNGTKMPSCLIELAFLDTVADAEILRTKQTEMAEAIAKGFFELLGIKENPAPTYKISEMNLLAMINVGVISSPDYWQTQNVQWLNELLSNAAKTGILDNSIDNGITDMDIAFDVLIDSGIISSPDYWKGLIRENKVQYLKNLLLNIANKCLIILEKIVHAEAQGEGEKGQQLVANVILNRHNSKSFPTGIHNVVFQKSVKAGKTTYQFSPIGDGAYARAVPSQSVKSAVTKALSGLDDSQGSLYFCSVASANRDGNWHRQALTELFTHGAHVFFK